MEPTQAQHEEYLVKSLQVDIKEGSKLFFKWLSAKSFQVYIITKRYDYEDIVDVSYRVSQIVKRNYNPVRECITCKGPQYNTMDDVSSELARKLGMLSDKLNFGRI